jgi:hypothetical protein
MSGDASHRPLRDRQSPPPGCCCALAQPARPAKWPGCVAPGLPGPRPPPVRVQRRGSATGVIVVCGQKITLGGSHAGQTLTAAVSDTTLAVEFDARKPAWCAVPPLRESVTSKPTGRGRSLQFPRASFNHHLARKRPASPGTRQEGYMEGYSVARLQTEPIRSRSLSCAGDA